MLTGIFHGYFSNFLLLQSNTHTERHTHTGKVWKESLVLIRAVDWVATGFACWSVLPPTVCAVASVVFDSLGPHGPQPSRSSVHRVLQARVLEWVTIPSFRGSSWPRDETQASCISCTAGRFFTCWAILLLLLQWPTLSVLISSFSSRIKKHIFIIQVKLRAHPALLFPLRLSHCIIRLLVCLPSISYSL